MIFPFPSPTDGGREVQRLAEKIGDPTTCAAESRHSFRMWSKLCVALLLVLVSLGVLVVMPHLSQAPSGVVIFLEIGNLSHEPYFNWSIGNQSPLKVQSFSIAVNGSALTYQPELSLRPGGAESQWGPLESTGVRIGLGKSYNFTVSVVYEGGRSETQTRVVAVGQSDYSFSQWYRVEAP
jgi:hypothetical protein